MTSTVQAPPPPSVEPAPPAAAVPARRRAWARWVWLGGPRSDESPSRGILSPHDLRSSWRRSTVRALYGLVLLGLLVASVGPLLWLAKAAVSTTQDTLREPFAWWPSGVQWQNIPDAWNRIQTATYLLNTVWIAGGSAVVAVVVATTGAYTLSVLRPRYARLVTAALLATLFIPGVVYLVPLYLTILRLPVVDISLVNSFWALWLPAGASSFNVLLVKRFMDRLPRDVIDAARVDGAGPLRVFWHIVLPLTRPIVGVLALLTFVTGWKEFLWPLLVLPDPAKQPLSVALPRLAFRSEESLLMAALFISVVIPVVLFLVFHRQFLRAASQAGATNE
jgi:multiple sugar transport system permease protein